MWWSVLAGCITFLAFPVIVHAQAAHLTTHPGEPFVIPIDYKLKPNTEYAVKLRLADDPERCLPECSGEMWVSGLWLTQSARWDELPRYTTNNSGLLTGQIIGRSERQVQPLYAQIAVREVGSTTTRIVLSVMLTHGGAIYPLVLSAYDAAGNPYTDGYFSLQSGADYYAVPLTETARVVAAVSSREVVVGFYGITGDERIGTQPFTLEGDGVYRIALNPPSPRSYSPELVGASFIHVHESVVLSLRTHEPYFGRVLWYVNGEQQVRGNRNQLTQVFTRAGQYRIRAELELTGEVAESVITVQSYTGVSLKEVDPNPVGRDSGQEHILLVNTNNFPVTLRGWELRSRMSSQVVPINLSVPSGETIAVAVTGLRNQGGGYDLYNESSVLVDTVSYSTVREGQTVVRDGLLWAVSPPSVPKQAGDRIESPSELVNVTGTVVKPNGRTIDIMTADQQPIRVVVHHSYDKERPRLHRGDIIHVTGIWLRSRRGEYVSVREGHDLTLVHSAQKKKPRKIQKPLVHSLPGVEAAQAASYVEAQLARDGPEKVPQSSLNLIVHAWLRWVAIGSIATGTYLVISRSTRNPV